MRKSAPVLIKSLHRQDDCSFFPVEVSHNLDSPVTVLLIPLTNTRARVSDPHAAFNLPTPDSTRFSQALNACTSSSVMNVTPEALPTGLDILHRPPTLLPLTDAPPTITLDILKRESRRRAHIL